MITPPPLVNSFEQAEVAWREYQRADTLAYNAERRRDGLRRGVRSITWTREDNRAQHYRALANRWADLLEAWIKDNAQLSRDAGRGK